MSAAHAPARIVLAALTLAATLLATAGGAAADDGHLASTSDRTGTVAPLDTVAALAPDGGRGRTGGLGLTGGGGLSSDDVDCFVDFDDDLVLQYVIPDHAENTVMESPWYQKCSDHYHPAVAIKPMTYGHFHLGYQDQRIGPCEGDQFDFGRKADPMPAVDDPGFIEWVLAPCVEDIDPVTEPRTDITAHVSGEIARIYAYDGDGKLPFQLSRLKVIGGDAEVCHLPPGGWEAAFPGGSPWQCTTLEPGYYDLSGIVDDAIEVRVEFLSGSTRLDNVGLDLL